MDCTSVKPGWYCAGEAGHDGPCAAWPPCHFCGYVGPGLEPLRYMHSICQKCIQEFGLWEPGDKRPGIMHVPGGDIQWDGNLWTRFKNALDRWFGW